MLVLTRNIMSSILIGPDIEVKILGQSGRQVRIGINAPKHIKIAREELANDFFGTDYVKTEEGKKNDS